MQLPAELHECTESRVQGALLLTAASVCVVKHFRRPADEQEAARTSVWYDVLYGAIGIGLGVAHLLKPGLLW